LKTAVVSLSTSLSRTSLDDRSERGGISSQNIAVGKDLGEEQVDDIVMGESADMLGC
jgi:hypothetical protein